MADKRCVKRIMPDIQNLMLIGLCFILQRKSENYSITTNHNHQNRL